MLQIFPGSRFRMAAFQQLGFSLHTAAFSLTQQGNAKNCTRRSVVRNAVPGHVHSAWPGERTPLDSVLSRVRTAVRGTRPLEWQKNGNAMAFGSGTHMGCQVAWTFIWRPDGAFYEEIRSKHLTYKWGFDGGMTSHCWEVDPTGVSKVLERDDHEATLLGALLKSGAWLNPSLTDSMLDVELEGQEGKNMWKQYMPSLNMPPVASTIAAAAAVHQSVVAAAVAEGDGGTEQQQQWQQQPLGLQLLRQQQHLQQQLTMGAAAGQPGSTSASSSSGSSSKRQPGHVVAAAATGQSRNEQISSLPSAVSEPLDNKLPVHVVVKLKGGRMLARVQICPDTWLVDTVSHPLCSDTEQWRFRDWVNWAQRQAGSKHQGEDEQGADLNYPKEVVHQLFRGFEYHYNTEGVVQRGAEIHRAYQLPASPPVPIDAQYLDIYSSRVPVWQTSGGHLLAECHINGRRAGWMILDTGASGFVIEPGVADQFALPMFGELRIAGVAGKVKTRYRRASQLRIGPLLLSDPVMMEMRASRLVTGFHDRVIGIAGFDVFRRCRMTLPCHNTRKTLVKAHSQWGKVTPHVPGSSHDDSSSGSGLEWPPSVATAKKLQQVQQVQRQLAAASHAADAGPLATENGCAIFPPSSSSSSEASQQPAPHRRRHRQAAAAAGASLNSAVSSSAAPSRRRRSKAGSTSTAATAVTAEANTAVVDQQSTASSSVVAVVPPVAHNRRSAGLGFGNQLIEMLLQRPQPISGPHELEDGYVWQDVVMIASLPHVELEFVSPGTGKRHKSLFMVDTGAGGTEMMFHARAARELGLLDLKPKKKEGPASFVSGVDDGATAGMQVAVQAGQLPELIIHGQAGSVPEARGSLVLKDVAALFSKHGGLDISLYSAGMVCVDLLARMQVVLDYPNRRIGWKVPPQQPPQAAAAAGQ